MGGLGFLRYWLGIVLGIQLAAAATEPLLEPVFDALEGKDAKIDAVRFFAIPVEAERKFSYTVQKRRLHAFISIEAGGKRGWTEANLGYDPKEKPFAERIWRMKWYSELKGLKVTDALRHVIARRPEGYRELEYAEIALLDLAGKLAGKPTVELLGLNKREPVAGVYCILSDDPEQVKKLTRIALEQKMKTHLKVKLFGDTKTDVAVVRAARETIGPEAYIVGDVNFGYRREPSEEGLAGIIAAMKQLHQAGLTACEDPAAMSPAQWGMIQRAVPDLDLVPDVPLRPSWDAPKQIDKGMGRVFNMHPACMGSYLETIRLGRMIQAWGHKLMVGDASLVGPACPPWQQLAVGLGADWVEAVEKPQENDVFLEALKSNAIGRTNDGRFELANPAPGFGVEIDEKRLRKLAAEVIDL